MTTADEMVAAATERAGLTDFGGDSWRPGLEILVRLLDEDPGVIADGRTRLHEEFVAALWNRLRVVDHVRRHPEIADQQIERPLVILGMTRTGTTLASYLLDRDPSRRSLLNWEAAESIPPPTTIGIRVNVVAPGSFYTGFMGGYPEELIPLTAQLRERNPIPRWGYPEDVEGIAAYLASDAAWYHTGDIITIDGGASAVVV